MAAEDLYRAVTEAVALPFVPEPLRLVLGALRVLHGGSDWTSWAFEAPGQEAVCKAAQVVQTTKGAYTVDTARRVKLPWYPSLVAWVLQSLEAYPDDVPSGLTSAKELQVAFNLSQVVARRDSGASKSTACTSGPQSGAASSQKRAEHCAEATADSEDEGEDAMPSELLPVGAAAKGWTAAWPWFYSSDLPRGARGVAWVKGKLLRRLASSGFLEPKPMQKRMLHPMVQGKDLIVSGPGSGRTSALAIGVLHWVDGNIPWLQALMLCSCNAEVVKLRSLFDSLGRRLGISSTGVDPELGVGHVVVATPRQAARALQQGTLRVETVRTFVLDGIDEMLDGGRTGEYVQEIFESLGTPTVWIATEWAVTEVAEAMELESPELLEAEGP